MTRTGGYGLAPLKTTAQVRGPIDTLIVAGGWGVDDAVEDAGADPLDPLGAARRSRRVTSVCSGTFLLAGAGLLEGKRATTHWSSCAELARRHPELDVDPNPIFVHDGDVWTSAGVTSGMDLALALVEDDLGREVALEVARWLVLFLQRPGGQAQFSSHLQSQLAERMPLRELQGWIADNLDADLRVEALAERAAMSPRNFARAFRREIGMTPAAYVDRAARRERPPAAGERRRADRPGRGRAAASAPRRPCAAPSPGGWASPPPSTATASGGPRPPTDQEEPTMQVAYLLYDRFTALDITGPHDVLNSVPDIESIFVAETGGSGPQRVGHPLAGRRRLARRGARARTSSSSPAASAPAPCSSTSRCSTGSGASHETSDLDDLGLHRLPAARRRRPARRQARDHPLARPRPARRAGRQARSRPRRRAGQDHHRRGRLLGDRHGAAPGPADVRRRGRPGGPARHRVRPPAAARRRLAREGPAADRRAGHGRLPGPGQGSRSRRGSSPPHSAGPPRERRPFYPSG